jgi:hypothetical protein
VATPAVYQDLSGQGVGLLPVGPSYGSWPVFRYFSVRDRVNLADSLPCPYPHAQNSARIKILTLIGVGGMGEVYKAHDTKLRRDVAVGLTLRLRLQI